MEHCSCLARRVTERQRKYMTYRSQLCLGGHVPGTSPVSMHLGHILAFASIEHALAACPADHSLGGLSFVLRSFDNTMWYKDNSTNFFVPVPSKASPQIEKPVPRIEDDLSRAIIEAEGSSAWTLMHR